MTASDTFLIRGGHVLSIDPEIGDIKGGDVLVRDGKIAEVGHDLRVDVNVPVIEAQGQFVLPGFVDTHTHMWNSFWRTVPHPYPNVHSQLGQHFRPEDSHLGVKLAASDMINSGVTTVHAWEHNCRTPEHVDAEFQALRDIGIRRHYSYGYHHDFTPDQMTDFKDIVRAREQWQDDMTTVGFASRVSGVPYDFYFPTALQEVREREWKEARDNGLPITHHAGTNYSSFDVDKDFGGEDVLFVHAYHWDLDAWKTLAGQGTAISLSPYAAMGYSTPLPFTALREAGMVVSLSYDHLSGPGSADTFRLMHMSHQQARYTKEVTSPRELVEYATLGGAKALKLDHVTGSLTPGKRADIILFDQKHLGLAPVVDPYLMLVNSGKPDRVSTVIVDGKVLKRDGVLMTGTDPEALIEDTQRTVQTLFDRAGLDSTGGAAL